MGTTSSTASSTVGTNDTIVAPSRSMLRTMALAAELTSSNYAGRANAYQLFAETPVFAQENALFNTFDREHAKNRALALIADAPASVAKAA